VFESPRDDQYWKAPVEWPPTRGLKMLACKFCQRGLPETANRGALVSHERFCAQNPDKRVWPHLVACGWNRGLTKETDPRLMQVSRSMQRAHLEGRATGRAATKEAEELRKAKIRRSTKIGGHRLGSGRGKKGWYKGIFCDSSWELAYVLYMLEIKQAPVRKNWEKFPYTFHGKTRYYVPDFILGDKSYVEIKGYATDVALHKLSQFPYKIKLLSGREMAPILRTVVKRFGVDFVRLYEAKGEVAEHGRRHSS
jgi:hypothetical protein